MIGIDFDDPEYGFKEEDKSSKKRENEEILKSLVADCKHGRFATMAEVFQGIATPAVKSTRPYKTYEGKLGESTSWPNTAMSSHYSTGLGDFEKYPDSALSIAVQRFTKTKQAKPPSASTFVSSTAATNENPSNVTQEDTEMSDAPDLIAVKNVRSYHVIDADAQDGKATIERGDLAKAYYYGSTAVPFGDADAEMTKFHSTKSFSIIGFIPNDKVCN